MRILSATEAVSPAIARMKLLLFKPFRFGRSWKLATTSYLGGTTSFFIPFPLIYLAFIPVVRRAGAPASAIAAIVAGAAVLLVIYMAIFYLCSRLNFAFFDIALNRGEFVAPAWRKYGPQSLKWTLFKMAIGTAFFALIAAPLTPVVKRLVTSFSSMNPVPGQEPSPQFMAAIFSFYAAFLIVYLIIGVFALLTSTLSDFVVPSLALENTSLKEALGRAGRLVRSEPGAVCLYILMKVVLYLAGGVVVVILFYIFIFAVILIAFLLGALGYFLLNLLHVPHVVMMVLATFFGITFYVFTIFYGMFLAYGTLYTITESYALYFLGGRYPLLGDLLERSTPPPENPPPAPHSGYVPLPPEA
jgi:hypothetical protein